MLARIVRWSMIVAPVIAGVLLLIMGTAGAISTTFGIVLIGLGPVIWMWNWFIRMSFDDYDRRQEETQQQAREQRLRMQRPQQSPPHHPPRKPSHPSGNPSGPPGEPSRLPRKPSRPPRRPQ